MSLANKISGNAESTRAAAGAAAQSSVAAPGPIAAPAIWPYAHRSLAQVDAADHSATIDDASARLPDGDGAPRAGRSFHANLNTLGEQRNHGA